MDKFLDTCLLPSLHQEEVKTLNRPIKGLKLRQQLRAYHTKKAQVQMGSQPNSTRQRGASTIPSETIPNIPKRGNPPQIIL